MNVKTMFSLLIFGCLGLAGCQQTVGWKEEVKLSTGQTITIEREAKHAGGGAAWPQGQGSIPREHIIRFKYPPQTGPLIEWHSTKLTKATYAELPLVLDLNPDKSWVIYTVLVLSPGCDQYLKYEFKNGVWAEIPLADDIGTRRTNLYLAAGSNSIKGLITLGQKTEENSAIGFRSRLKQVGPKRFACDTGYRGPYPPDGAV